MRVLQYGRAGRQLALTCAKFVGTVNTHARTYTLLAVVHGSDQNLAQEREPNVGRYTDHRTTGWAILQFPRASLASVAPPGSPEHAEGAGDPSPLDCKTYE